MENYKKGIDSLVYAVCGSGKTEIVLTIIQFAIQKGVRVGFVIPRRDVVIEIADRLKTIFKDNKVVSVYGGHNESLEADIVCLTSHQLYRYKKYFGLLIIDEIDAFPFKGNKVLEALFLNAIDGPFIKMSATPSEEDIEYFKKPNKDILELTRRYHGEALPVPQIKKAGKIIKYFYLFTLIKRYKKYKKPLFIFCPSISICEKLYDISKIFFSSVNYVHSKRKDRELIINNFKKREIQILFTTSVLERGVTVKDLQVVVFNADHKLYTEQVLIQISGRVGRKIGATKGDVIFICEKETNDIKNCISKIESANKTLH